jgi:[acyl-carrier-protein] S-malonyltransferase
MPRAASLVNDLVAVAGIDGVLGLARARLDEGLVAEATGLVAAALAHSPAARLLLARLEAEQHVPEAAVRDYYDRNRDRFLTPEALRNGADPFQNTPDVLPYEQAREGITRDLRRAAGHRAFFDWLDQARTAVVYAPGHEHPGDPSHQDHEHRH